MLLPGLMLAASAAVLSAQPEMSPSARRNATRPQLDSAATRLDRLAASSAYGERTRQRARTAAAAVRRRLIEGDFRPGDRIVLHIELHVEGQEDMDDTATVLEGKRLQVRGFRQVSLDGVLRSELEPLLRDELADFMRSATISARPLMRVAVFGSVVRQGYLTVPAETTIDDLLTLAMGLAADANAGAMTLQRGDTVLLNTAELRTAVAAGSTISALGLEDGDALMVPRQSVQSSFGSTLQTVSFILSAVSVLMYQLRR